MSTNLLSFGELLFNFVNDIPEVNVRKKHKAIPRNATSYVAIRKKCDVKRSLKQPNYRP